MKTVTLIASIFMASMITTARADESFAIIVGDDFEKADKELASAGISKQKPLTSVEVQNGVEIQHYVLSNNQLLVIEKDGSKKVSNLSLLLFPENRASKHERYVLSLLGIASDGENFKLTLKKGKTP